MASLIGNLFSAAGASLQPMAGAYDDRVTADKMGALMDTLRQTDPKAAEVVQRAAEDPSFIPAQLAQLEMAKDMTPEQKRAAQGQLLGVQRMADQIAAPAAPQGNVLRPQQQTGAQPAAVGAPSAESPLPQAGSPDQIGLPSMGNVMDRYRATPLQAPVVAKAPMEASAGSGASESLQGGEGSSRSKDTLTVNKEAKDLFMDDINRMLTDKGGELLTPELGQMQAAAAKANQGIIEGSPQMADTSRERDVLGQLRRMRSDYMAKPWANQRMGGAIDTEISGLEGSIAGAAKSYGEKLAARDKAIERGLTVKPERTEGTVKEGVDLAKTLVGKENERVAELARIKMERDLGFGRINLDYYKTATDAEKSGLVESAKRIGEVEAQLEKADPNMFAAQQWYDQNSEFEWSNGVRGKRTSAPSKRTLEQAIKNEQIPAQAIQFFRTDEDGNLDWDSSSEGYKKNKLLMEQRAKYEADYQAQLDKLERSSKEGHKKSGTWKEAPSEQKPAQTRTPTITGAGIRRP